MSIAVRLRTLNVFYFSLFALFISFLPVYASKIGISGTNIGLILGLGSAVCIVSQPVWGIISDKFRTIKKVLLLLFLLSALVGTLLFQSDELWLFTALVVLMNVVFLPSDALMETLNYQTSQREGISFGSIRTFGSMGFSVTSIVAGSLLKWWGIDSLAWIFLTVAVLTFALGLGVRDVPASSKPTAFKHLASFVLQKRTLAFFLLVLIVAIPHKMNDMYIGLYIEELGGNVQWTGFAWFTMTITETLLFAVSARLIKPGREGRVMAIAAGLYVVRFLLSSIADGALMLVLLQVLQGFTFVLFYVGSMQFLYSIVPEQWKSTGQTMLTLLFFGVSGIVGSTAGGWLFDEFGGAVLYRIMTGLALAGFLFSLSVIRRRKETETA
ncbi:MFS transporter [Cohnella thailandensis]|uniref:MFS transporter n=1 Tax=Cohnella thailandensis TaxID=557557 RepID=A0A841SZC3_9BACL|nr:MFS transporter [Cohnella thailandensis]MBB6635180.1 MFS transporter [Cohnella thailandensis]MBP1974354.1 PPP family 3-phenylpropionic acid transporter [Cohnella thailandensis]